MHPQKCSKMLPQTRLVMRPQTRSMMRLFNKVSEASSIKVNDASSIKVSDASSIKASFASSRPVLRPQSRPVLRPSPRRSLKSIFITRVGRLTLSVVLRSGMMLSMEMLFWNELSCLSNNLVSLTMARSVLFSLHRARWCEMLSFANWGKFFDAISLSDRSNSPFPFF